MNIIKQDELKQGSVKKYIGNNKYIVKLGQGDIFVNSATHLNIGDKILIGRQNNQYIYLQTIGTSGGEITIRI